MTVIKKIIPTLIFGVIFILVILNITPPQTFTTATIFQILLFFIPLLFFLTSALNLVFNFYLKSFVVSLGIILLLVLKALDFINILTIGITILAIVLLIKSFKKPIFKIYKLPKLPKLR